MTFNLLYKYSNGVNQLAWLQSHHQELMEKAKKAENKILTKKGIGYYFGSLKE